eukprot:2809995-Prymnesium_polylepis.2
MSPVLIVNAPGVGTTVHHSPSDLRATCSEWQLGSCFRTVRKPASRCGEMPSGGGGPSSEHGG